MKLTIDSICLLSSIIDKINIDNGFIDEMIKIGQTAKGRKKEEQEEIDKKIGIKIALKLGSKLHEVRDEIVSFIANYKEITKEEAEKIDIIEIFKELMNDENFMSFFKQKAMSK